MHESLIMLINVPELTDRQVPSIKMYECCRQLNGVNLACRFAVCVCVCVCVCACTQAHRGSQELCGQGRKRKLLL